LDAHLVLPLLEFALARGTHASDEINAEKLRVLMKTNLCDLAKELPGADAKALDAQRTAVIAEHGALKAKASKGIAFAANGAAMKAMRRDKAHNAKVAEEEYETGASDVEALYAFGKLEYECGDYASAAEHLGAVQFLSVDAGRSESALWGKFAADILMRNWSGALDDMNRLRDAIENNAATSALKKMRQRTWLLHYALFVFFNHPNGRNLIIDLMFQERYMQAVQQEAPYLMRYLAVAVLINKKRRNTLKDLVRLIQSDSYRDPALEFILALFVEYDFSKTREALATCDEMLDKDFFLVGCKEAFDEAARQHVVENYCKVNKTIDIKALAEQFTISPDSIESWIANLIRTNRLNAKIDAAEGVVRVNAQVKSVNEQIIEKTKALLSKTKSLTQAVMAHNQTQAV